MKKVAISIGDPNGVSFEIIFQAHETIKQWCHPIYCLNQNTLDQAVALLGQAAPSDMTLFPVQAQTTIEPSKITAQSGLYSFRSFQSAIGLVETKAAEALVTLPIHKEAWSLAGLPYKGHTDYLRKHFKQEAIMMLGCEALYVALFTEHIPLKEVALSLSAEKLHDFLLNLYKSTEFEKIGVLGLNPHAGDGGVLGDEEFMISSVIQSVNQALHKEVFIGPLVPDTAFTPHALASCNRLAALYHDQGLAPLKALYFDQSINVSLNLPIWRTSVDHGTAFDIAFKKNKIKIESFLNAVKMGIKS